MEWYELYKESNFSDKVIATFTEDTWKFISANVNLSNKFIKIYQDKLDWELLTSRRVLTIEFVREFVDKVDWKYISKIPNLSEEFIEEFKHRLIK